MKKLLMGAVALLIALAGYYITKPTEVMTPPIAEPIAIEESLGASVPVVVALFETSLASSISNSDTSMTLVSGTDIAGNSLSGFTCFTIDEGTSVAEFVCGTASGTAVTAMTRGVSPVTGTSSVASLKFSHRRGASVKITDHPQVAILSRIISGSETIPNQLIYDSAVSSSTMGSNLQNVASVAYVNGVSYSGTVDASSIAKGIVEAGTAAEILAGTGTGGTGALLFAPGSLYNATSSATTLIPVTRASGKLHQGFLDLTESFTFSGTVIHSATTTLATTTITGLTVSGITSFTGFAPTAPTTTPTSSSTLVTQYYVDSTTFDRCTTGVTSQDNNAGTTTIAHLLGVTPKIVRLTGLSAGGSTGIIYSQGTDDGTTQQSISVSDATSGSLGSHANALYLTDGTQIMYAISTLNSTNIILGWNESGTFPQDIHILWEACK